MEERDFLSIHSLTKSYGDFQALKDIDLNIKKGEIFGLLGPNGAGKTTLIRIITQIYAADKGQIYFDKEPLNNQHLSRIGYLPEERGLYKKMTVHQHLQYLGKLHDMSKTSIRSAIQYWLDKFNLGDRKEALIGDLSKGNQQKVQFIAAILHDPDFIILDEPFSGFDPINAEILKSELLEQHKKGKTILYSTHRMESVEELCDNIALFNNSTCIYSGNLEELKKQHTNNTLHITLKGDNRDKIDYPNLLLDKDQNTVCEIELNKQNKGLVIQELNNAFEIIKIVEHELSLHDIFLKLVK